MPSAATDIPRIEGTRRLVMGGGGCLGVHLANALVRAFGGPWPTQASWTKGFAGDGFLGVSLILLGAEAEMARWRAPDRDPGTGWLPLRPPSASAPTRPDRGRALLRPKLSSKRASIMPVAQTGP
jgi:hypothetical protein